GATGLPDLPVWKVVLDTRNNFLYVGTDQGVFRSMDGGLTWALFGLNLPQVQVLDLALDQAQNTLTVATYGRGMYQIRLPAAQANTGALRVVSGSVVWTGPIRLAGDTLIRTEGTQTLQNGIAQARLNLIGSISDLTPGANYRLSKSGGGDII